MTRSTLLAALTLLLVSACDGDTPVADAGMDGGADACSGATDGTECGDGRICLGGECAASECGDGYLDEAAGEECDDGNTTAFDGCEPGTCTFTCSGDSECDDGRACNGAETCTDHVCQVGDPPGDGASCTRSGGEAGVCRGAECVSPGCGNGVVDAGEECDDGNDVDRDGCDGDCTFSCNEDIDCADGDVCNGEETCEAATHACHPGTPLDCDDGDACTDDVCDSTEGCQHPLIDADGDGHAATSLGACGDDCDDTRADVYPGAEELCDGVDNNCNTDIDEVAPTWYVDCDGDGFAAVTGGSRTGCTEPPSSATGCSGRWTTTRPVDAATTDCLDTNPDVFPGQTAYFTTAIPGDPGNFDYNCDGVESKQHGCALLSCGRGCTGASGYLAYDADTNPNGCQVVACLPLCYYRSPDCGVSARYRRGCATIRGICLDLSSEQAQGCH